MFTIVNISFSTEDGCNYMYYFSQNSFSFSGLTETRQGDDNQNEFIKAVTLTALNPTEGWSRRDVSSHHHLIMI